ncbi:MAG: cytochrome c3 family protein [Deferribacteraceae bacterium]|jgi:hypothetical protein|nr:cytochrome c3 family protein [Deferribacteraceae bacterium]
MKKFFLILSIFLLYVETTAAESNFNWDTQESAQCFSCHNEKADFLKDNLHTTKNRKENFVKKTFEKVDKDFGEKNCGGCHISTCAECHKKAGKPEAEVCIKCHKKLGADYLGYGARDYHSRYQRGISGEGKYWLKMLPDTHREHGMACGTCHSMPAGNKAKGCLSCHSYSPEVIDHRIENHKNLNCEACHAAWSPNEYGIYFIKLTDKIKAMQFRELKRIGEYAVSAVFVLNEPVILGKDAENRYSPIRPLITFFSDTGGSSENVMLADTWKPFYPHTIRRETLTCEGCHNNRRKYLLERDKDKIFLFEKDGLPIGSFYNSRYFSIENGAFVTEQEYLRFSAKTPQYAKWYIQKIEQMKGVIKKNQK